MTRVSMGLFLLIGGTAAAALTIAPASHDFGKVAVKDFSAQDFTTTLPRGAARGTSLSYAITGPDAVDFIYSYIGPDPTVDPFDPSGPCSAGPQGIVCIGQVEFRPQSKGPKRATLEVTDNSGNRATAALRGEAVLALCLATVVWCNYSHHYSGVVSWSDGNAGVNVDVVKGVASCNATGESELASGPGLIGVEFDQSIEGRSILTFYRITVACPIRYPPEPARPAELGHGEISSYKQPLGMTIAEANAGPPRLKGQDGEVSWNLCPAAQYRPAVRVGPGATSGAHDPCPDPARRSP